MSSTGRDGRFGHPAQAEYALQNGVGLELALLCDALDLLDRGAFLFAVCEEGPLRERLIQHVSEHLDESDRAWSLVEFSPDQPDLAGALASASLPSVVFVRTRGLAEPRGENILHAWRELNFQREQLNRLGVPIVFWVSQNTLGQAATRGVRTLALPSLSTGVYGYPLELAAPIALGTVADFLRQDSSLERVTFVLFNAETMAVYAEALEALT